MNRKVGIWIRVSTEDQAKGESPLHHEERGKAYAALQGWDVVTVYHLEGVSGKTVIDHPEARRMLQDIKFGRIQALIFSKIARFARNTRELLEFADYFTKYNADLISLRENIDTTTPAGRHFFRSIASMAEWEREEIADRVAASVPIRAKLGKSTGGSAPYGYKWVDKKLVLEPTEALIRKKIFEYFLECKRKKLVAKRLNEEGYRTRNGSLFGKTTIGRLLQDPIAKGIRKVNYVRSEGTKRILKGEESWVFVEVPAIVSEELWQKCNDIFYEIAIKGRYKPRTAVHIFGGMTFCDCGAKMYVRHNSTRYVCVKCRKKIEALDLEEVFYEQLKTFLSSREEIDLHSSDFKKAIDEKQILEKSLTKEIEDLKRKIDNLLELHDKKELPTEGFNAHYTPLFTQQQQKQDYLAQIQGEMAALIYQCDSTEAVFTEASALHNDWYNKPRQEKRYIIEDILEKIIIGMDTIEIVLQNLPNPSSSKLATKGAHIP